MVRTSNNEWPNHNATNTRVRGNKDHGNNNGESNNNGNNDG